MISSSVYLIEDDFSFRTLTKNTLLKKIKNKITYLNLNVIEVNNINTFYKNIANMVIGDFDIFLVDIQLQTYVDGLDFGAQIRKNNTECKIIYLTSVDNKAIQIINQGIAPEAYLMKELDAEIMEFELYDIFKKIELEYIVNHKTSGKTILLNSKDRSFLILLNDILYISVLPGLRNTLLLKTEAKEIIIDGSINKLKKELPHPPFALNLKSYIINTSNINYFSTKDGSIEFKNKEKIYLSPKMINKIKADYKNKGDNL